VTGLCKFPTGFPKVSIRDRVSLHLSRTTSSKSKSVVDHATLSKNRPQVRSIRTTENPLKIFHTIFRLRRSRIIVTLPTWKLRPRRGRICCVHAKPKNKHPASALPFDNLRGNGLYKIPTGFPKYRTGDRSRTLPFAVENSHHSNRFNPSRIAPIAQPGIFELFACRMHFFSAETAV
jgi:hypothetical protein